MKNRIHDYEAGWLTFLVSTGLATLEEAKEAQRRVAVDAVDELRRQRRRKKRKKIDPDPDE